MVLVVGGVVVVGGMVLVVGGMVNVTFLIMRVVVTSTMLVVVVVVVFLPIKSPTKQHSVKINSKTSTYNLFNFIISPLLIDKIPYTLCDIIL